MEFRKMAMITLYARQQKRHRCIQQSYGLLGESEGGMIWENGTRWCTWGRSSGTDGQDGDREQLWTFTMVPGARPGSFHVSNSSMRKVLLLPLFTDEETEARGGQAY